MVERLGHVVVQQQLVLGQHTVLRPAEKPHHALGGQLAWGTMWLSPGGSAVPGSMEQESKKQGDGQVAHGSC